MKLNLNYTIDLDEYMLLDYIEEYDAAGHSLADIDSLEDFISINVIRFFCSENGIPDNYDDCWYRDSTILTEGLKEEQFTALRNFIKESVIKFINNCFDNAG